MEVKTQKPTTIFILILLASHFSSGAPANTWVGSKYQIECTMCASCDNPCNQQPPPQPQQPPSPPPPSTTRGGGGYYYSPPPPTSGTGGGGGYYYYSPPPPSQGVSVYPPPSYGNYPNPEPPNPIMNNFPYYYHGSPVVDSASGTAAGLLINVVFLCLLLNL